MKERRLPDRPQYKVTIVLSDGTELVELLYANNAEHAKRKALQRVPENRAVSTVLAEEKSK